MAEQIKMLFGVNTLEGNIVLDVSPNPPQKERGGPTFKFWDPRIAGTAEARDLKFSACTGLGAITKTVQQYVICGYEAGSRDLLLTSAIPYISGTAIL